jgi:hypothetical protein
MKNRFEGFTEQQRNVIDEALCRYDEEMIVCDDFYSDGEVKTMLKIRNELIKEVQKA